MLVAAFAGRDRVLAAYQQAVAAGYRFYSYGDADADVWSARRPAAFADAAEIGRDGVRLQRVDAIRSPVGRDGPA